MVHRAHIPSSVIRVPSAYVPILMSLCAMLLVLVVMTIEGAAARQPDEGAAAHLFQLLIVAQLPIIGLFWLTWWPRDRRFALQVLAGQAIAIALALLPVWLLGL